MATFTVNSNRTFDEAFFSTRAGNDTYNLSLNARLTIDTDTRYCTNATATTGNLGPVTISAASGGEVYINGNNVRVIPYNTGTGNVPATGTTVTQGGVSAVLLGVWSALNAAPTAAGAAMPTTGWVKVKNKTGGDFAAGAITGPACTATGPDIVGWIEVVGVEAATMTISRTGKFTVRGNWFELYTTSGSSATTYQLPASQANTYYPGVWVETAVGTGEFEHYPCAGSLVGVGTIANDTIRGKMCWISSQGLLRFGTDGTNTNGFLPAAGLRIRTPNVITMNVTAGAMNTNAVPNATLATRYDFTTTGAGTIDIENMCLAWHTQFTQPYAVRLLYSGVLETLTILECATAIEVTDVLVGQTAAQANTPLFLSLCLAGGTFTNLTCTRASLTSASNFICSVSDCANLQFLQVRTHSFLQRGNVGAGAWSATRVQNSLWNACVLGCGSIFMTNCSSCIVEDVQYYDRIAGSTNSTAGVYAASLSVCSDIVLRNFSMGGLFMSGPYLGFVNISAGCARIDIRQFGSSTVPLDCGAPPVNAVSWSRSGTTATVTSVAHGLKVGDAVYVRISSDIAAITVASKTIATVPTANTFTFAALNAGSTSGTLSYTPTVVGALLVLASSVDIRVQQVYLSNLRQFLLSSDNSSTRVVFDNVYGSQWGTLLLPALNMTARGVKALTPLTAQTSVYGTHWYDGHFQELSPDRFFIPWTRSSTTATVTSVNHGLRTGDFINVIVCSDTAAVVRGVKTITALTPDTFSFTCLNAGGASGTMDFEEVASRIAIQMNEPTANTAAQVTVTAGTPTFTSTGQLYMPTIGDQVVFTTPYQILGYTHFCRALPVMLGGTLSNHHIEYQIDLRDGNGYSSWKNLAYPRTGGGGASASTTVTMTNTTGVSVGDYISGTNVAVYATVVSVDSSTNITVSLPNIGTVSGTLTFFRLPTEVVPSFLNGFNLKWRFTTVATNVAAITALYVFTGSTDASRNTKYPLDFFNLEVTGLPNGTIVRVYDGDIAIDLIGEATVTGGGKASFSIPVDTYNAVNIVVAREANYLQRLSYFDVSSNADISIPLSLTTDLQYTP